MRGYIVAVLALCSLPVFVSAESIETFEAMITPRGDGSFVVNERVVYDFGSNNRHGIFRHIPTDHPQAASTWYKERYTDIELREISMDGADVPYTLDDQSDALFVRIGDPDVTISGVHTYNIEYQVHGGYSYFDDGSAELYWNVTGTDWNVPIDQARAIIQDNARMLDVRACYEGGVNSNATCNRIIDTATSTIFIAENLAAGEGLTVAQAIDRDAVGHIVLERMQSFLLWGVIALLWLGGLGYFVYRYRTHHRTGRTIIAQYEPYEDFKPMYTGVLIDGAVDPKDITAGIVYLAEQGFLKIKKTTRKAFFLFEVDDYEVSLLKDPQTTETAFQRRLLELLFGSYPTVGATVALHELKQDRSRQKANHRLLKKLKRDVEKDLENRGFFDINVPRAWVIGALTFLGIGAIMIVDLLAIDIFGPVLFPLGIIGILSIVILFFAIRRRTRKGYEALDHLEGFKLFLSVTDAERFKFHNAPEKSPETFMQYLPYAIAFGVEKEWAEVFEDVTIPDPEWYDSGSAGSFSATNLTTSLGAFSTAFASSSGSSGSSGGGSVGGGGGGGGGGSW